MMPMTSGCENIARKTCDVRPMKDKPAPLLRTSSITVMPKPYSKGAWIEMMA